MGVIALCSLASAYMVPASASPLRHDPGIGISHSIDGFDVLAPLMVLTDIATLPATPSTDEPTLHEISGTGPVAPVYRLSHQTDGAIFRDLHRRC